MIDRDDITGLILAGGRGSRMGGVDKGLQAFRGQPLVAWTVLRLAPQVGHLVLNANRNIAAYEAFGYPVAPDGVDGYAGPLAGFQAGLAWCETPYMASAPCDSPFLPDQLISRLAQGLIKADAQLAVVHTAPNAAQPVFTLMRADLAEHLKRFVDQGGRKIDAWYATLKVATVDFSDCADDFLNLNSAEDLHSVEQRR